MLALARALLLCVRPLDGAAAERLIRGFSARHPRVIKYIFTNVFLTDLNDYDSPECFEEGYPVKILKKTEFFPIFFW